MAPRAAKDTWRTHELVTKAIYEALLKQSNPEQWDIKHDTKLVGLKTCHQIDVYWKFRVADFEHFVIVQVKKKKERVKQGDLLLFSPCCTIFRGSRRVFSFRKQVTNQVP